MADGSAGALPAMDDGFPPDLLQRDALFLDFDGTLVDIAARPEDVVVAPDLIRLLGDLRDALGGAVAIISGRLVGDLDAFLSPLTLPSAGLHGAQIRRTSTDPAIIPRDPRVRRIAAALMARFDGVPGVLVEDKGAAVALHFRLAPERVGDCREAITALMEPGLEIIEGHCVFEARPNTISKAHALRMLCQEAPFNGRRPVFVGDDRTDEDGFAAALLLGGFGVKVGPGNTRAMYRLPGVQEVRTWLRRAADGGMPQPVLAGS